MAVRIGFAAAGCKADWLGYLPLFARSRHPVPHHRVSQLPNFVSCGAKNLQGKNQGKRREILPIFQRDYFNRECASSIPSWSASHSCVRPGLPRDARMARKSRLFAHSSLSLDSNSPDMGRKSPKVSGPVREYSRFAETIGGDWFDHDCRPKFNVSLIVEDVATESR